MMGEPMADSPVAEVLKEARRATIKSVPISDKLKRYFNITVDEKEGQFVVRKKKRVISSAG